MLAFVALLGCLFSAAFVGAGPAYADSSDIQFENIQRAGGCLSVLNHGNHNGAAVALVACRVDPIEKWYYQRVGCANDGQGFFDCWYLVRSRASGRCLDVSGGGTANNTTVFVWDCLGARNQQWAIGGYGEGLTLRARHSGKCLTPAKGSARLVQWDCVGARLQQWKNP